MTKQLHFESREEFREWLMTNCISNDGVWLVFGKEGGPKTLTPSEALEEALCFGWIDSQLKSLDDKTYIKYFTQRRKITVFKRKSAWKLLMTTLRNSLVRLLI